MDAKDRQIIRELQRDGRLTNQELAARVNLSPSPCLRRLRQLEERGIITGYTALVDQKAYGAPLTVFVGISLQKHEQDIVRTFEKRIAEIDSILDCYLVSGDTDYMLRVIVPDLEIYEHFVREQLQAVPGIGSIDTRFAYGVIKSSTIYPELR